MLYSATQIGEGKAVPECRRKLRHDRRVNSHRTAFSSLYRNRRRGPRRDTESHINSYVDVHDSKTFFLAFGACFLSILDACFTILLLSYGGSELNPFMDYLIQKDMQLFFLTKLVITTLCVSMFVVYRNHSFFRFMRGYQFLVVTFIGYALLIGYELTLINLYIL